MNRNITLCCLLLYCIASTAAQQPTKQEIKQAVDSIISLVRNNYVFADKAAQIANAIAAKHKAAHYDNLPSWKAVDSALTHDLKTASNDGHMYVRYDTQMVKELSTPDTSQLSNSEDPFYYGQKAVQNNFGFKEVKVLDCNIGYIRLSEINISEKSLPVLISSMKFVANTRALIIDLRNNGGGGSSIGSVIESFFLPKGTPLLQLKNRAQQQQIDHTVSWLTEPKYTNPLYIIVNKKTFSAAEAVAFSLQQTRRAIIVGQPSGGGAHMNSWYPINRHLYLSVSTAAPTLTGTDKNWEGKGVIPDVVTGEGSELEQIFQLINKSKSAER